MKLVKVTNRAELHYMIAWCEDNGFSTPFMGDPEKYPIAIGADGGWTDLMDRAADYVSFSSFVESNTEAERLIVAETSESISLQSCPDLPPAEPSWRVHGLPQETVPTPISHAMEFCFENCRIAQRSTEPTDSAGSDQQRCRFPQHCAIESVHGG